MNILGVHYGHNATAALLKDGKVVFAMSEERLNRLKNSNGMPVMVLEHIYKNYVKPEDVDAAVLFQKDLSGYYELKRHGFKSVRNFSLSNINFGKKYSFYKHLESKLPFTNFIRLAMGKLRKKLREFKDQRTGESMAYFSKALGLPKEKILFSEHHASHAYACCFNLPKDRQTLVFTMDGEGDGESSTISIWDGKSLKKISSNPISVSIGYFFTEITKLLGMTPNEHEFKVMGLAPYAKEEKARKLYEEFKQLLWLDDNLNFQSKLDMRRLEFFLLEKLYGQRFDTVAAFAQIFLEEKVLEWIRKWIEKTGIKNLAVSGGVFMSVKLNQKISELSEVESLFVMPSGADESTAIGAAFYGGLKLSENRKFCYEPILDLCLGNEYKDKDIETYIKEQKLEQKYKVEKFSGVFEIEKKVAKLLSENQVVGRFAGRSEWGARALGNRSLLANPSSAETIKLINEMIKNRDFWMPFAASVLKEEEKSYLKNPKNTASPHMTITFHTTELAQKHLKAAIHPYDYTSRPQLVDKVISPRYHALISEFRSLTGIGAVLNTSFNLHGEPNVETPADAIKTLENSGLNYLALENFLISKK